MKTTHFQICFIFLLCVFNLFTSTSVAKEYEIPTIQVEVSINRDGTLRITEHLTYFFKGEFSWANYELPKNGSEYIRDIRIAESKKNYTNLNTEEPGTFLVEETDNTYNLKWFYNAKDEVRTFSVSYTLGGAITTGPKWSEFFWNYASAGREKSTEKITILVKLPEMVPDSNLHSWVREPTWAIESTTIDRGFKFKGSEISKNQAVIIRTVFPTSVFNSSEIEITNPDFSLAWAKNEEANYRQEKIEASAKQERAFTLGLEMTVILIGISIISFIYFYRRYGTRHQVHLSRHESLMIPGNQKPAAIGWLLSNRNVTGNHLTATLLDLARRGHLTLKEEETGKESWFSGNKTEFSLELIQKGPDSNVVEWEKHLLYFLQKRIQEEGPKMKDIFKYSDSQVSRWYQEWRSKVEAYGRAQGWIDQKSYTGVYWNLGIQIFLMLSSAVSIFLIHPVIGFATVTTVIAAVLSVLIIRRSPKGEELFQSWKNYSSALKTAKEYSIPKNQLGQHFIYSTAFGIAKGSIEQMFKQNPDAIAALSWIIILPGSTHSPAQMATSFSSLAATGTISSPGGATGSGASPGSAGGGASAGAG